MAAVLRGPHVEYTVYALVESYVESAGRSRARMPMRGAHKSKVVMKSCKGEPSENMCGTVRGLKSLK
jgi:hypothetical protein